MILTDADPGPHSHDCWQTHDPLVEGRIAPQLQRALQLSRVWNVTILPIIQRFTYR